MSRLFDRLRHGERCWGAEIVLRATGLLLLGACWRLFWFAHRTVPAPPHQATFGELEVCAAILLALTGGLALTLFGPRLLAEVTVPGRSGFSGNDFR